METKQLTKFEKNIMIGLTLTASFLSVLMMFLLITAFPKIMVEFAVNSTQVQWLTTSFMLTMTILIPITAYFIDTYGTRAVMLVSMVLFVLGTFISLIANSFGVLLLGRIIQGMGSGMMMPLMQTILYILFPRSKRGYAMGLAGMIINVAPAVGPPLSGLLIHSFGWRSLFYVPLPIGLLLLVGVYFFMHNVTEKKATQIDFPSILLSTIGFGTALYGFTMLQDQGELSLVTILSMFLGLLAIGFFVHRQLKLEIPILEVRVLKTPVFSLVSFISILAFTLLISFETMMPMFVQNAQGFSAYYGGLVVMPGALTLAIVSFIAGKLFDLYGGKMIVLIGFIMIGMSGLFAYIFFDLTTPFIIAVVVFMLAMAGSALINMPVMTIGINALPDDLIPHGTSVINTLRQFGGTLGLVFIVSFISREEGEGVGIDPSKYMEGVSSAFFVISLLALAGFLLSLFIKEGKK